MQPITSDSKTMEIFRQALVSLNDSELPYVMGGAFAVYHYTTAWRNTNDLDVYMEPDVALDAMKTLSQAGFQDFGEMAEGDRDWIYHAVKNGVLVDIIWQPPNHLQPVDSSFYDRATEGEFIGIPVRFMPLDELMWSKLFTMNHERTDWPDVFRLVRSQYADIDWDRLIDKLGEHWQVLLSFIVLFDWTYPSEVTKIPTDIRQRLLLRKLEFTQEPDVDTREHILDPWIYTRPYR